MIYLRPYTPNDVPVWDDFVDRSINATFLLKRGYMDYHSDRFCDRSLIAVDDRHPDRPVALMPGCERVDAEGRKCYSTHAGLTYGGWLLTADGGGAARMLQLFDLLVEYLRREGYTRLIYKQIPSIYHRVPAQEEDYALWRLGAHLEVCNIAATIELHAPEPYAPHMEQRRRRGAKKAAARGYTLRDVTDLSTFWAIVDENLRERYNTRPVHTLQEIQLLQSRFPNEIRCRVAECDGRIEAGVLYYLTGPVVHSQYPHSTPRGKEDGAMDLIFTSLIEEYRARTDYRYFDFGISNEDSGRYLNESLAAQKEGFGGRGVAYRIFQLDL